MEMDIFKHDKNESCLCAENFFKLYLSMKTIAHFMKKYRREVLVGLIVFLFFLFKDFLKLILSQ
jgi:hypothetical protein